MKHNRKHKICMEDNCNNEVTNLRENVIRCKECGEAFRRNRWRIYEKELRKQFGWYKRAQRVNRPGTMDVSPDLIRNPDGTPNFEKERISIIKLKRRVLHPNLKKGVNVLHHTPWLYTED